MQMSHMHLPSAGQESHREMTASSWRPLYRIGAVSALMTIVCVLIAIPVFLLWPPPGGLLPTSATVIDCFTLIQSNWLVGLLDLDLLIVVSTVLLIPLYLALYVILRRASPSLMAIALAAGLVGTASYFSVNPAFAMLSLSAHYTAATGDAQRSVFVAAGLAALASYQGTGFDLYYLLEAVATLIISVVMLRSTIFSKATAYLGVAAGVLMLIPPTVGTVGVYLSLLSLAPLVIWYLLVAWRLFQAERSVSNDEVAMPVVSVRQEEPPDEQATQKDQAGNQHEDRVSSVRPERYKIKGDSDQLR